MKMIKWGVLGTAGIAHGQTIPGMVKAENCELYAIAGRNPEKADAYAKEFGFEKTYYDYDELLADPAVEAVYIPLPNTLHFKWAMRAILAGKHVLCEKPLAPTAEQAKALHEAAKEKGVFLMEAFAYLHSPLISAIKAELDSGIIGDVLYIDSCFLTSDYNMSNIRMRRETCGGSTYDLGCYNTSMILTMLGKEPLTVQAVGDFSEEHIDKFTTALMTFEGGVRASMMCGMTLATEKDRRVDRLIIEGTRGKIATDAQFNQCGTLSYTVESDGVTTVKTVEAEHNYALEVAQLGRCIEGLETPRVTAEFTYANARVIDRILAAIGY